MSLSSQDGWQLRQQKYVRRMGLCGPGDWIDFQGYLQGGFCWGCDDLIGMPVLFIRRERTLVGIATQIDAEPARLSNARDAAVLVAVAYEHERHGDPLHTVYCLTVEADYKLAAAGTSRKRAALLAAGRTARDAWFRSSDKDLYVFARVADHYPTWYANCRSYSDHFRPGQGAG
jgi:hypothetical protein